MSADKQPKALRLADALKSRTRWHDLTDDQCDAAAAELQRLHELNAQLLAALRGCISEAEHVGADGWMTGGMHSDEYRAAVAAIAAATQATL